MAATNIEHVEIQACVDCGYGGRKGWNLVGYYVWMLKLPRAIHQINERVRWHVVWSSLMMWRFDGTSSTTTHLRYDTYRLWPHMVRCTHRSTSE